MSTLGKKIVIVGVSASGKSTFARKLAAKIGLPVVFVDALVWKPGWDYIGDEQAVEKLDEESSKPEWIIEGFIDKKAFSFIFERADTIIYLDYSRIIASWRYVMRWWRHHKSPRPELPGSPEKFSFEFFLRVWNKKEVYWLNKFLEHFDDKNKIIMLRSPRETELFLEQYG
jgi:adenylate kinase family enzyme